MISEDMKYIDCYRYRKLPTRELDVRKEKNSDLCLPPPHTHTTCSSILKILMAKTTHSPSLWAMMNFILLWTRRCVCVCVWYIYFYYMILRNAHAYSTGAFFIRCIFILCNGLDLTVGMAIPSLLAGHGCFGWGSTTTNCRGQRVPYFYKSTRARKW